MNVQVLINKFSCAEGVYKIAIKRRRIVTRAASQTEVTRAAMMARNSLPRTESIVTGLDLATSGFPGSFGIGLLARRLYMTTLYL